MIEKLFSLFREAEPDQLDQSQREAIIDLLVWAMYADGHLAEVEHEWIGREVEMLTWTSAAPASQYVLESATRLRGLLDDKLKSSDYLHDIVARLSNNVARKKAMVACEKMVGCDAQTVAEEQELIDRLRAILPDVV